MAQSVKVRREALIERIAEAKQEMVALVTAEYEAEKAAYPAKLAEWKAQSRAVLKAAQKQVTAGTLDTYGLARRLQSPPQRPMAKARFNEVLKLRTAGFDRDTKLLKLTEADYITVSVGGDWGRYL